MKKFEKLFQLCEIVWNKENKHICKESNFAEYITIGREIAGDDDVFIQTVQNPDESIYCINFEFNSGWSPYALNATTVSIKPNGTVSVRGGHELMAQKLIARVIENSQKEI